MTEYRIAVGKEALTFSAGHFITYGGGECDTLHGHNYRVAVLLAGRLDEHGLVYDFVELKRRMQDLLGELDHRVLLPVSNPELDVRRSEDEIEVRLANRRYVFPAADAVVLPVANTTAERLAEYLCERLTVALTRSAPHSVTRIEVEVEECPGQSAWHVRELTGRDGAAT